MRERYRRVQDLTTRREARAQPRFDVRAKTARAIELWEDGDVDGYRGVVGWLQEVDVYGGFGISDPRELAGWTQVDDAVRDFVRNNAVSYLRRAPVDPEAWFDSRIAHPRPWAAYRAFRLLHEEQPEVLAALEDAVWARWAPIIVGWPPDGERDAAFSAWAVAELVRRAPPEAVDWLDRTLRRDLTGGVGMHSFQPFAGAMPAAVEDVVLRWARNRRLAPAQRAQLLAFLLEQDSQAGLALSRRLVVPGAVLAGGRRQELAARAAALLAVHRPDADWQRTWPLFAIDEAFGTRLVEMLASEHELALGPRLTERQIVELYGWVEDRYPHATEPVEDEVHFVGLREEIAWWRNGLLDNLVVRGTQDAVRAFDALYQRFPSLIFLKAMRVRAAETARLAQWTPPAPQEVLLHEPRLVPALDHVRRQPACRGAGCAGRAPERLGGLDPRPAISGLSGSSPQARAGDRPVIGRFLKDRLQARESSWPASPRRGRQLWQGTRRVDRHVDRGAHRPPQKRRARDGRDRAQGLLERRADDGHGDPARRPLSGPAAASARDLPRRVLRPRALAARWRCHALQGCRHARAFGASSGSERAGRDPVAQPRCCR